MKLQKLRQLFHQELNNIYSSPEIEALMHYYFEDKIEIKLKNFKADDEILVNKNELTKDLIKLKNQQPYQQVVGFAYFFDLKFKVNQHTLIPRPETEELIDWILSGTNKSDHIRILDIGTGSGCIPISLKKPLPNAEIFALDFSAEAIAVAKENARIHDVDVKFMVQDILQDFEWSHQFDLIVSNPPYIRNVEKRAMQENVLNFEPHSALFVEDENPLVFYQRILELSDQLLDPKGKIYLEINQYLGSEMEALYQTKFENVILRKDISGNDRMLKAYH